MYKLGKTKNIEKRLLCNATYAVTDTIIKHTSSSLTNRHMAEDILFEILKEYRMRLKREFFKCEFSKIKETIDHVELIFSSKENIIYYDNIVNKIIYEVYNTIKDLTDLKVKLYEKSQRKEKYCCEICNYSTYKKSSFDNHLKSDRHERNSVLDMELNKIQNYTVKMDNLEDVIDDGIVSDFECRFCSKKLSCKRSLRRHNKICQAKTVFEHKEQLEKELILKQDVEQKMKIKIKQLKDRLDELEKFKNNYYELLEK